MEEFLLKKRLFFISQHGPSRNFCGAAGLVYNDCYQQLPGYHTRNRYPTTYSLPLEATIFI